MITKAPVLKFYDVKAEATIHCDASEKGLGATLLQNEQPVAFVSRSLTKAEQNYAQIEKECLAIVFACERFNQYIHGREQTTVHTDHRPLVPIFNKPIYNAPKRLQRMLLRLQKYTLTVQYCPGRKMHIADMLSRAYLQEQTPTSKTEYQIFQLQQEHRLYKEIEEVDPALHVRLSENGLAKLREATTKDNTLSELSKFIHQGWPEFKHNVPLSVRAFWPYRDELVVDRNIVFKGTKVVIPKAMRPLMLQRIHSSHQGPVACSRRARDVIFWPGMTKEVLHLASQCAICNEFAAKQQKEPLMSPEVSTAPWSMVAQDLFTFAGKTYLITIDYYSDFWELDAVNDASSDTIIECTKAHFARYGIPEKVITDNGPQFRAQQYEDFARQWGFSHVTSSPYHSQSNGKAESAVKIAKSMLKKVTKDRMDVNLAILSWRNTPTEGGQYSPVQKLHSRRTRTQLPTSSKLLKPKVASGVVDEITHRKHKTKQQYDRTAKELPPLVDGQTVRIQPVKHKGQWEKATVIKKVSARSYIVKVDNGKTFRRNRKHLRQTNEAPPNMSVIEQGAEDEAAIPTTIATQQTHENDQMADSNEQTENVPTQAQNQPSEAQPSVSRTGRVSKPPTRLKDYVRH